MGTPAALPEVGFLEGYLIDRGRTSRELTSLTSTFQRRTSPRQSRIMSVGTPAAPPEGWVLFEGFLVGPGANLSRANYFFGFPFSGSDLSGANLSGIDFFDADLSGANLSGADLSSATFFNADFSGADLRRGPLGLELRTTGPLWCGLEQRELKWCESSKRRPHEPT